MAIGGAGAASSNVTVSVTVASASWIDAGGCATATATATANVTDFGTVLPGSSSVTTSDCAVKFGSSNDTAMLRAYQQDGTGQALANWKFDAQTLPGGPSSNVFGVATVSATTAIVPERGGAITLHLEAVGHAGVPFSPGQFAWLRLHGRAFALAEHPFSFASSSCNPAHPSFTVKHLGDFTSRIQELAPGTKVLVDGPHGAYEPTLPHGGFVLLVAGIGVTPAMSFLRTSADLGDMRPIRMVYGARSWDEITFREELELLGQRTNLELVYVLSQPPRGRRGSPVASTPGSFQICFPPMRRRATISSAGRGR